MDNLGGPLATEQPIQFQRVVVLGRGISDADMAAMVNKSLVLRPYSGQTTNLLEIQDSNGNVIGGFSAAGLAVGPDGGSGVIVRQTVIAPAAVLTLRNAPVELVPAPGAGLVLQLISLALFLDYATPAFTESTANLQVRYTNGSGIIASQLIETTGFIDQAADTFTTGLAKIDVIGAKSAVENKALVLHNEGAAEFGGAGGSTLRVRTSYVVHPTGW